MTVVEIALDEGITEADAEAVRQSVAELHAYIHQPVSRARLTVRRIGSGRVKLRRQVDYVAGKGRRRRDEERLDEALPVDLTHRPEAGVRPPSQRRIVRRRTYLSPALGTLDAVDDLLSMDLEFMLFVHARTHEDVTVHLRDDGRFGLLFPARSPLAEEDDIVVPRPSRHPGPLALREARIEMDFLDHRFLYFPDAEDKRRKVIYLRHDGDYGLVGPT